ncbi:MAG: DUF2273 domain-containing protein [Cetobacterium sp.]|uniref:DUF2273 domain-containing protein n=1 Tax=unclassified Cetobacterium TaxID=2630983 RepID=UPI00163C9612|nr:DUF2273 domain-containing protein [Cetobacterium sp. 2A]MBC2855988.1 DUF2273 domain-containing protein [Cetobacterium sp. 2A]
MLEELIERFIYNLKKFLGCVIGLVVAILLVEYGFLKTLFIVVVSFIGYNLGDVSVTKKIKKKIIDRLKD